MIRRTIVNAVSRATAAAERMAASSGWVYHRGVLVLHPGIAVDQTVIKATVDFVARRVAELSDDAMAEAVMARTIVRLVPGQTFEAAGGQYAGRALEHRDGWWRRGVVTVAADRQDWPARVAMQLVSLWARRAGIANPGGRPQATIAGMGAAEEVVNHAAKRAHPPRAVDIDHDPREVW